MKANSLCVWFAAALLFNGCLASSLPSAMETYVEAETGNAIVVSGDRLVFEWAQTDLYQAKGSSRSFEYDQLPHGELLLKLTSNEIATPKADLKIVRQGEKITIADKRRGGVRIFVKQETRRSETNASANN